MSLTTQDETSRLLNRAEAVRSCLVPPSETIAQRLRRRLRRGTVMQPYRGIYVRTERWKALNPCEQDLWMMRAISPLHPDWVFCGISAAEAYELWVSWRLCGTLYATHSTYERIGHLYGGRRRGGLIRWRSEPAQSQQVVNGIRVTSLDETVADCLREHAFIDSLGLADSWLHQTDRQRADLIETVERWGAHRRGVDRARYAAAHADGRSENGGESYARARMIDLGYATPELQVEIPDPMDPWNAYRVDYLWDLNDGSRIIGELDGMIKYTDPVYMGGLDPEQVRARERHRESRLAMPGTSVMRFFIEDVNDPRRFGRLLDSYGVPKK